VVFSINEVLTETKKMVENAEMVRRSYAADQGLEKKRNPSTKERSSTELRFASFPALL
jgi:hypothetical protein